MNLDQIIQILITLMPLLPIGFLVRHAIMLEQKFVPAAEFDRAKSLARMGVMTVQQTCSAMSGPDKKSEAVRYISTLLNEHGLKVSPATLDALIESSVLAMNQGQDPQATQSVPSVKP